MRTQIQKGAAGELAFVPEVGPVSSVSVELFISGDTKLVASPTASVDSFDQTLTAAVSAGATSLSVADTSGLVLGDPYWLQTAGGRGVIVRPIDKTSTAIELDQPIPFAVADDGSVVGHRCSVSLSSTDTATKYRRCEARWTYTVGGRTRRFSDRFDIVQRPFALALDEADVEDVWPGFGEHSDPRGTWRGHVAFAEAQIELWLDSHQRDPDLCREPRHLIRAAAAIVAAREQARDPQAYEQFMAIASQILESLEASHLWIDVDDDLVVDDTDASAGGAGELGHGLVRYATVT